MGLRLDFQNVLETLVTDVGGHVYFQPPDNVAMQFPAIVYNRDYKNDQHADNVLYSQTWRWLVTVIDRDPDSPIPDRVAELPMSKYVRHYTTQGLNHDVYYVYYRGGTP